VGEKYDRAKVYFISIPREIKLENGEIVKGGNILLQRESFDSGQGDLYQFTDPILKIYTKNESLLNAKDLFWESHIQGDSLIHFLRIGQTLYAIAENNYEDDFVPIQQE